MTAHQKGGCHCGKVRYSFSENPALTFFCHCNDCQRTTGNPFSVELMVPADAFSIDGDLSDYTITGDSGKSVHRLSCSSCGSGVYLDCEADPDYVFVKAGTLDDSSHVKPEMHIYTAAKQLWLKLDDGLPQYEKAPPE